MSCHSGAIRQRCTEGSVTQARCAPQVRKTLLTDAQITANTVKLLSLDHLTSIYSLLSGLLPGKCLWAISRQAFQLYPSSKYLSPDQCVNDMELGQDRLKQSPSQQCPLFPWHSQRLTGLLQRERLNTCRERWWELQTWGILHSPTIQQSWRGALPWRHSFSLEWAPCFYSNHNILTHRASTIWHQMGKQLQGKTTDSRELSRTWTENSLWFCKPHILGPLSLGSLLNLPIPMSPKAHYRTSAKGKGEPLTPLTSRDKAIYSFDNTYIWF